ncbi:glycoside hydrolase N-terminal domain-containing protein, partial [Planctomycetota bacterium]
KDYVQAIREAIAAGDIKLADDLTRKHMVGDTSTSNLGYFSKIGELYFRFKNHDGTYSNYRRELDVSQSLGRISYRIGSVNYTREYFCSYPDRVLVMQFSTDSSGQLGFSMRCDIAQKNHSISVNGTDMDVSGRINGSGREFRVKIRVLHSGGRLQAEGQELILLGANEATVILAAATEYRPTPPDYKGADPQAITSDQVSQVAEKTFIQLKERHIRDYQGLYNRVRLTLEGDPEAEKLPTNQRWENLKKGNTNDTGLKVLLFNFGRYLLISASRPGTLPSNLQGVWNWLEHAPWNGNYQSNINLQEMYWPCGAVNLLECQEAYIDWIKGLVVPGRLVAEAYYGTKGWISQTVGNIWGFAAPGGGLSYGIYPVAGAWHCQHLWEHYAFSMDKRYLAQEAYPVMKEAAEFWLANLVPYEGYLISAPTVSAEHGAPGGAGYTVAGVYQDIEMIYDLFTNVIEAAEVLGIDQEFRDSVEVARSKLLPLKIGKYGQLQEWYEDLDSPDDHHRHISHLWAVHPGQMIDPLNTPKLAEAAKKSLNMRGDGVFEGWPYSGGNWARTWRIWCWARLWDGDRANKIFTEMIVEQGFENLMTFQHIPPENRMQVDGSMSTPGFMAEMLLQSHLGEINLLPALPSEWPNGNVEGLIARGGYVVDVKWDKGTLTSARIKALKGGTLRIRVKGKVVDPTKDPRLIFIGL